MKYQVFYLKNGQISKLADFDSYSAALNGVESVTLRGFVGWIEKIQASDTEAV